MPVGASKAKQIDQPQRKSIALEAIQRDVNITELSAAKQVSRKFIYEQKNKAIDGIDQAFSQAKNDSDVLFYLPVTKKWIRQFVLCLILHCKASYRGISKTLIDCFDFSISIAAIHNIMHDAAKLAGFINDSKDLSGIQLAAHDEMFHHNQPILSGVDINSLYCHLLSLESNRDGDTWAIRLWDLELLNFKATRIIADDGDGLTNGHQLAFPETPLDLDNFHTSRDLMDMRRYFRNKLRSSTSKRIVFEEKMEKAKTKKQGGKYSWKLLSAQQEEATHKTRSTTIDTLISWMEHDVLNIAGLDIEVRKEIFDFIVDELEVLAAEHPHRIQEMCDKLRRRRDKLLAYVSVLNTKFEEISIKFECGAQQVWKVCQLQRYDIFGDAYHIKASVLESELGNKFDAIEDEVIMTMEATERTSSMIENEHSRIRPYLNAFENISNEYLGLLRFYLNHTPFLRSSREHRENKTPWEILSKKQHKHWLEMLGYTPFKRAA
jgi:hypothetical protein